MDEGDPGQAAATPVRAGDTLRGLREAQGLSIADVGARTRIPTRHLSAIEAADYTSLPSATYAVGFAKAYARAVGADEVAIAAAVRGEVDRTGPRVPEYEPYDVADPARVPSRGVAIVGVGVTLAILILVGLWYGTDWFRGGQMGQAGSVPVAAAPTVIAPVPVVRPTPAPAASGPVVLVANDEVWMRVYDAANTSLYLGTLQPGERFEVPANANDPMINVGRPDKLTVTVGGTQVAPLGTGERAIKDVRIGAAALLARAAGQPAPAATATTSSSGSSQGSETRTPRRERASSTSTPSSRPRPALSETQRANIEAAQSPPPPAPSNGTTP